MPTMTAGSASPRYHFCFNFTEMMPKRIVNAPGTVRPSMGGQSGLLTQHCDHDIQFTDIEGWHLGGPVDAASRVRPFPVARLEGKG